MAVVKAGAGDPPRPPSAPSDADALVREAVSFGAAHAPEIRARLANAGVRPESVKTVTDLSRIPVLAKDAVPELQAAEPPFGGMLAVPVQDLVRIYSSPGPILDPEGPGPDFWRFAPALEAAGFGPGQIVLNTFSYHLTPGGMMLDGGLRAVGCVVIPGGVGNSAAQIELARSAAATGYVGTPQFLLTLLEKAVDQGTALRIERALVTGAPFPSDLRRAIRDHGVDAYECYGTADAGTLGFECGERTGWHVAPGVVIEILHPETGEPRSAGETGEVVVTRPDPVYPLVRFGTGDLSALEPERCRCGRTGPRLRGFLGRSGQGVKVKGMFVHPRQISAVLADHPGVLSWQGVVTAVGHRDVLTLRLEADTDLDPGPIRLAVQEAVKLKLAVEVVEPGSLPGGGRKLVDRRGGTTAS